MTGLTEKSRSIFDLGDHCQDVLDTVAHEDHGLLCLTNEHGQPVVMAYSVDDVDEAIHMAQDLRHANLCRMTLREPAYISAENFCLQPLRYLEELILEPFQLLVVVRESDGLAPFVVFHAMRGGHWMQ